MKDMKRAGIWTALLFAFGTGAVVAARVDARLVPDGTYGARIERVRDGAHATMLMENGIEVDAIAAPHTVTFTPDLANVKVKVSFVEGEIVALSRV